MGEARRARIGCARASRAACGTDHVRRDPGRGPELTSRKTESRRKKKEKKKTGATSNQRAEPRPPITGCGAPILKSPARHRGRSSSSSQWRGTGVGQPPGKQNYGAAANERAVLGGEGGNGRPMGSWRGPCPSAVRPLGGAVCRGRRGAAAGSGGRGALAGCPGPR